MAIRYPPMSGLRALEAVARHLSCTRAAEERWDIKLFKRWGCRLALTKSGYALVPVVRDLIRRLTLILDEITHKDEGPAALRLLIRAVESWSFVETRAHPISRRGSPVPRLHSDIANKLNLQYRFATTQDHMVTCCSKRCRNLQLQR